MPVRYAVAIVVALVAGSPACGAHPRRLEYIPAPVDNPLKGLVPYRADVRDRFPHSLEFSYLPYSALVRGYDEFDWDPLEAILDDIACRGHQAVFRIYLEYPGERSGIPQFLRNDGLQVTNWLFPENDPPCRIDTPDYEDENLRRSLRRFIAALGRRYDGDPRVGFITAGLLGVWGEWHTHPRDDLFASKAVQCEVMDAYEAAFSVTPILLRYPAGAEDPQKAKNAGRPFGYHDDSFAWGTLHTGKKVDGWFYMTALKSAGPDAEATWKTRPIGGEIRPEAWGRVFDEKPGVKGIQNFRECVAATHVTWLMDTGMFGVKQDVGRVRRAEVQVGRMGYEFHAPAVTIGDVTGGTVEVKLEVENRGVAPFYYDWRAEWGLLADGKAVKTWPVSGTLRGLLPGEAPRVWGGKLDVSGVNAGTYTMAVRVPNPLQGGKPLRFANEGQVDTDGWLPLGHVRIPLQSPELRVPAADVRPVAAPDPPGR